MAFAVEKPYFPGLPSVLGIYSLIFGMHLIFDKKGRYFAGLFCEKASGPLVFQAFPELLGSQGTLKNTCRPGAEL